MYRLSLLLAGLCLSLNAFAQAGAPAYFIRINQTGYLPLETKQAIVFSHDAQVPGLQLMDYSTQTVVARLAADPVEADGWGTFSYYWKADFSKVQKPGWYYLATADGRAQSVPFQISGRAYEGYADTLLIFMRQQRCGYNPHLDMVCHQRDGRSMFGPMPDSTFVEVSGGYRY